MADPKKVLVFEDEKPLSHALELKLTHEGMTVMVASDGQEGLNRLASEQFDVVLLDMMMPVVNGFQVLEYISKLPQKPVVFVLSNLAQSDDRQRVMALGARDFFVKSDTPLSVVVEAIKGV